MFANLYKLAEIGLCLGLFIAAFTAADFRIILLFEPGGKRWR
jgi:hypothetical protein